MSQLCRIPLINYVVWVGVEFPAAWTDSSPLKETKAKPWGRTSPWNMAGFWEPWFSEHGIPQFLKICPGNHDNYDIYYDIPFRFFWVLQTHLGIHSSGSGPQKHNLYINTHLIPRNGLLLGTFTNKWIWGFKRNQNKTRGRFAANESTSISRRLASQAPFPWNQKSGREQHFFIMGIYQK